MFFAVDSINWPLATAHAILEFSSSNSAGIAGNCSVICSYRASGSGRRSACPTIFFGANCYCGASAPLAG